MTSGNFIIGNDLSLDGFNYYLKPEFEKYQVQTTDIMPFNSSRINKSLLISLTGNNGSLEEIIKKSLEEAQNSIEKDQKRFASNYQLRLSDNNLFETLGIYQDDKTASKVYQNLAIKYSLIDSDNQLDEFENRMSSFAKKFK